MRAVISATYGQKRRASTLLSALLGAGLLLTLASAAALVVAPAAEAVACGGATVTAAPMHSPNGTQRPFYGEFRSGSTKHSGYVGYELTDNAGALGTDVWVRLSGFTGGALGLAANQSASVPVRATSGSGKRLVYAYLTATAETATAQTFTVEIWNGKPGIAGSTQVCTMSDGFSEVMDVLDAAANKITSVSVSTSAPALGGSFSVTAAGDTGTMGAGDASDQVGGNGVFSMAPSMEDTWPADAFTLTGVEVVLGGTTYRDRLRIYPGTAAAGAYTAKYTFTVRKTTAAATPVRPVQNIASGTQVKYTGSYSGTLQDIGQPVLTTALAKSPASLTGPPYAVTYQVVASNSGGGEVVLDYLRDTPTPSSAWTFQSGSARLNGAVIADPQNDSNTLVFKGPFTLPANGSLTFRYTLQLTATVANSIVGLVGDVEIGGSGGGGENAVTVDPDAPIVTTATVPGATQGTAYSTTFAASSGTTPYTWSVSAGSLPPGLTLNGTTGVLSGTPTTPGSYSFTIRVTDAALEQSTRAFTVAVAAPDTTAPAGASLEIDGGAASTTATAVTLTLAATDAVGVTAYRVANGSDCSAAPWVSVTATTSLAELVAFTLVGGDGTRTVCAQFRDVAGNVSSVALDTIALDATAPLGSVTAAGGAAATTTAAVTLSLAATDAVGVTAYRAAAGADCSAAAWTSVASTASLSASVNVTLAGGDGTKSVCAEYRDALGNVSSTVTDTIELDTTVPSVTLTSGAPDPTNAPFVVTAAFSEAVSGFAAGDVVVGNGSLSGFSGSGSSYSFTVTPSAAGSVTVDVAASAAVDAAGNTSLAPAQLVRTYDAVAPTGTITLAGGAASTTTGVVAVTLAAADVAGVTAYRFAAGSDCSSASWVSVASTATLAVSATVTLGAPDGAKTACAQFRDAAGNVSATVTDAIVLDTAAPTAALALDGGAAYATSASVTLTLASSDAIGVVGYRIAQGSDCSSASWVAVVAAAAYSTALPFTLSGGDGTKTVCAQYRDAAGHVSSTATAVVELDTAAPSAALASTAPATTTSPSFPVTLTFSEAVTGLTAGDIAVGNGSVSALAGSGTTYTFTVTAAAEGAVTIDVGAGAALDAAGLPSTAATTLTRTYDATAPAVTVTSRPAAATPATSATIAFTVSEPLAAVTCAVDGGAAGPCASPLSLNALALGPHSVVISATDAGGNTGSATVGWTVVEPSAPVAPDTTPPTISILSFPPAATPSTSATIPFAVDDADSTTTCSLDGGAFVPCAALVATTQLAPGRHRLVIRAVDAAGNAASKTVEWTVAPGAAPDVRVAITSTTELLVGGRQFDLTAVARNAGTATATGVVLTVTLPPDAEFVRGEARLVHANAPKSLRLGTAAFPCALAGRLVSCAVGSLDPEDRYVVVLTLRALRTGGVTAVAATDATNARPAAADLRTGSTKVSLTLRVHTKRPFNDVRAGETFTATATLKNAASRAAAGVRTTIVLPRGTRLVGTPPRSCRLVAAGVSCDVGTIAGNGKRVLRLRLRSVAGGHVDLRARASTATQKRLSARASVTAPNGTGCTIYGTTPVVLGTPGDDVICLSPGFHLVLAGTGDDIVYGRSGRQVIYGGAGNDVLYGDADDDYLDGGPGRDLLEGGRGDDKLLGRADDDRLRGGGGRDRLHGGVDADVALADADDLVFEVESGDGGWRTGTHGAAQLIVKRGSR